MIDNYTTYACCKPNNSQVIMLNGQDIKKSILHITNKITSIHFEQN